MVRLLVLICLLFPSPALARSAWWDHVQVMAADSMEGRGTATAGYLRAAGYVARELERIGIEPAGVEGYYQSVPFLRQYLDESQSGAWLVGEDRTVPLEFGRDVALSRLGDPAEVLEAPAVFVGYGISFPEFGHDDLEGIDLRGKIAVLIRGAPASMPNPARAIVQERGEQWSRLRRAGAVGLAVLSRAVQSETAWARIAASRFQPAIMLADPDLNLYEGMRVRLAVNAAHAALWFEGSGHSLAEILEIAERKEALPGFPLTWRLRVKTAPSRENVSSPNVLGLLAGRDPHLQREYVILTAHLYHLGIGAPAGDDSIYNGALDNASGTATLLEIARQIQSSRVRPRRSLLFLFLTGEEEGLLGSRYFAQHPTIPAHAIVANVNVDMFLPIVPFRSVTAYGHGESDLGGWLAEVARKRRIKIEADSERNRSFLVRSDQYSFIKRGIPAVFIDIGADSGSSGAEKMQEWMRTRYHAPSDDLAQPIDLKSAVRFTRFLAAYVRDVADRLVRPRWKPGSFFRRFEQPLAAAPGAGSHAGDTAGPGAR